MERDAYGGPAHHYSLDDATQALLTFLLRHLGESLCKRLGMFLLLQLLLDSIADQLVKDKGGQSRHTPRLMVAILQDSLTDVILIAA